MVKNTEEISDKKQGANKRGKTRSKKTVWKYFQKNREMTYKDSEKTRSSF